MNMRAQRITTSQQEVYLIYLSEHLEFAASKIKDGDSKYDDNWKSLTKMLNNTLGPKKSIEEWKTVFLNWKNQLKTRSKRIKQIQDGNTNTNEKNAPQKFTDVEKRALKLWKEDIEDIETISIMHEIESKDVTITPIKRKENIIYNSKLPAKRKISDTVAFTINQKTGVTREFHIETQSTGGNATTKPAVAAEELLAGSAVLRSADVTVQEILDWANNNKVPQSAVNELLQVLRVKRIKTEIKTEGSAKSPENPPSTQQTLGLYTRIIQRLEGMEKNLINRITILERKVDMKNQNVK